MASKSEILARAAKLLSDFEAAGATPVEADLLQPAGMMLDLYGEEIRARTYVTSDALRGEQMLRPDFTVPVVQMHMASGADPARYTYAGEVFRRQEHDPDRPNEYIQVGFEIFDRSNPAASDAEVFTCISAALSGLPLRATTGDIGILMAAVSGLSTTERRKTALMRHIWRPRRFRTLLERFAGRVSIPPSRAALLAQANPMEATAPDIGKRTRAEIADRIDALREDAEAAPLGGDELTALERLLSVRETLPFALEQMRDIAVDLPSITPALDRMQTRIQALSAAGVDVETLEFEASHGRTSMEYYDGFVFAFHANSRADLPPVATGGRYDALTRQLGRGHEIPAVGGVLRPGLMLALEADQ